MVKPQFNGINEADIVRYIKSQGYGIASVPGWRIALTRPVGTVRKMDGQRRYEFIGGVQSSARYDSIKAEARSAAQVGAIIIKIANGGSADEDPPMADQVEAEVKRREENQKQVDREVQLKLKELGLGEKEIEALKAGGTVKRKPGRPRKVKEDVASPA